jgi:hypothetical protein
VAHLYVTLIVKELKISVQHGRVVTTIKSNQALNIIFSVVEDCSPNYTQMEGNNLKTSIISIQIQRAWTAKRHYDSLGKSWIHYLVANTKSCIPR